MKCFAKKIKITIAAFAGMAGAFAFAPLDAHATATSVVGDGNASNTLVAASTSSAAAAATAAQIGAAVASAIVVGSPAQGKSVALAGDGKTPVGYFFNTRSLGESAGTKNRGLGVWVQGAWTGVDNGETGGEFDGTIINVVGGIDYKPKKLNGKAVFGIAVAWEDVDVDTDFNVGTFEGSGVSIAPYAGVTLGKNLVADISLGYSFLDYDVSRTLGGTVTSDFDAYRIFGAINLGGDWTVKKRIRISPKIGVLGFYEEQDAYTDSSGTNVGKTRVHLGRASGGAEVGFMIKAIEPFIGAKANFDFDRNAPVRLANGVIAEDDEFSATFSAGVNLRKKNVTGQIKGETNQFKNEITSWSVIGRVRVDF